jgi:hypothetical protein
LGPAQGTPAAGQDGEWAICCSGGGIRSASYCLGALQGLQISGLLGRAGLVLGVSGGSYTAASRALVANGLERQEPALRGPGGAAYALGSPEEQNLRDNTHYLAPNGATVLVGVLSLLVGVAVTFIFVSAPLFVVAHAWGWLLRSQQVLCPGAPPQCPPTGHWSASVTSLTWWPWPAAAGVVTFGLFWWWWATLAPRRSINRYRDRGQALAKAVAWAALVTAVLAVAMLVVPLLLSWLAQPHSGSFQSLVNDLGFGAGQKWSPAALVGAFAAVVAIAQSAQAKLAQWHLVGGQAGKGKTQGLNAPQPGFTSQITGWIRVYLLPWLASIAIVLAFAVAGLRWVKDGAAAGYSPAQLWPVLIALGIVLATRVLADVNRISMHDFYRWRLASAYSVKRKGVGGTRKGRQGAEEFPGVTPDPTALLSRLRPAPDELPDGQPDSPMLVICATANINAAREVPVGRGGLSMTFDPDHVILRGELEADDVVAQTRDYEVLVGERRCTLFDVSAISGAAVSPLMGSMTRQAYRILLTLTNVRLGVWLPHPAVVVAAHDELAKQESKEHRPDGWWTALSLLLWYVRPWHPRWGKHEEEEPGGREARLWAYVLRMRRTHQRMSGFFYHVMQPTLGLLWAEAVGHTSYRSTWVCVSDGGHYDNLGLVEALKRGAKNVVVLDASGDKADTWFTLGGAFALARVDAGIDINLNPSTMIRGGRDLAPGQVVRPWARGTFSPIPKWQGNGAEPGGQPQRTGGNIWVCKLGWSQASPWDVRAYARTHSDFPTQTTLQQLYDGAQFDAYRELGLSSVIQMMDAPTEEPVSPTPAPNAMESRRTAP